MCLNPSPPQPSPQPRPSPFFRNICATVYVQKWGPQRTVGGCATTPAFKRRRQQNNEKTKFFTFLGQPLFQLE